MAYDKVRYDQINRMKTGELIEVMILRSKFAWDIIDYNGVYDNEFMWAKEVLDKRFMAIDEDHIRSFNNMLEDHKKDQGT